MDFYWEQCQSFINNLYLVSLSKTRSEWVSVSQYQQCCHVLMTLKITLHSEVFFSSRREFLCWQRWLNGLEWTFVSFFIVFSLRQRRCNFMIASTIQSTLWTFTMSLRAWEHNTKNWIWNAINMDSSEMLMWHLIR